MSETKTYAGSCHCGKVRFEIQGDLTRVVACNCSICSRAGWLLTFVPEAQFTLLSGEDAIVDYQFGKKRVHHPFCRECGIHAFGHGASPGSGAPVRAINVRCLEGVDPATLEITHFDGKKL